MTDQKPVGSRPYARLAANKLPSVTTVLDVLNKPGLSWGAAKETALFAVHHQDEWTHLDPDVAADKLRRHHKGVWDSKAAVGSIVHALCESWITGEVYEIPEDMRERVAPYVAGLAKFWSDFGPSDFRTEDVVRRPCSYIGTRDLVGNLGFDRWLLDIKTTAEQDPTKGLYGKEWALQLSAYRYATEVVHYERNEKGRIVEVSTEPNEEVDRCGIIHLRGDGEYTLYELDCGLDTFDIFMSMAQLYMALKDEPTPKPVSPE